MAGALEGDLFVGPKAEEHRGLLSIRYPMEHGIVTDWNDMEHIWGYIYSKVSLFLMNRQTRKQKLKLAYTYNIVEIFRSLSKIIRRRSIIKENNRNMTIRRRLI